MPEPGAHVHTPGVLTQLWEEPFRGKPKERNSFSPDIHRDYSPPKLPAHLSFPKVRAMRKLVLRSTASLDSEPCGHLLPGASVLVLKREDKIGRVCLGSTDGKGTIGWVTSGRDGEQFLRDIDAATGSPGSPKLSPKRGSPRLTPSQQRLVRATHDGSPDGDAFLTKLGEVEKRSASPGGLMSSAQLLEMASSHVDRASTEEGKSFETFASRVGRNLITSGRSAAEIAEMWDRNGGKARRCSLKHAAPSTDGLRLCCSIFELSGGARSF